MSIFTWILLLYAAVGISLAIAIMAVSKQRRLLWTTVAVAAYVLVPFGDQIAGSLYLKYLCSTQARLQVYKTVDNVSGFLSKGRAIEPSRFDPYLFVENEQKDGSVSRLTVGAEGKISRQDHVSPISRYGYRESPLPIGLGVVEYDRVIEDLTTGEVLASERRFNFKGGWILYQMFGSYDVTQSCESVPRLQGRISRILKPAASPFLGDRRG